MLLKPKGKAFGKKFRVFQVLAELEPLVQHFDLKCFLDLVLSWFWH